MLFGMVAGIFTHLIGGSIDYSDQLDLVLENINAEFYLDTIRKIRFDLKSLDKEVNQAFFLKSKMALKDHYNATPESIRNRYKSSSLAQEGPSKGFAHSITPKKMCEWCQKHNRRRVQGSHTKEKCFYGDKEGWDKVEANKPTPLAYFTAYHDTASTPRSYFKDRPENFREVYSGSVMTADNKAAPVKGIGSVKFGDLELKEVAYVPSFSKNLVSGIQIMKQGYKQVIDQDLLQVFKNNELVATGHYDEDSGLIKMNNELTGPDNYSSFIATGYDTIHSRLGHPGDQLLKNTLQATDGIKINGKISPHECETCRLTKTRKSNVRKEGWVPDDYLEVVESDTQGPFSISSLDGTRNNIKFVDKKSRYVRMETIQDREAITCLNSFKRFKARLETLTGRKLQNLRTDGGTEYKGEFMAFSIQNGIAKQTGTAYEHNHPGQMERIHQTIMTMGRAMLKESKLPALFYGEAQMAAVYIYNRQSHCGDLKTPYEHIFKRKPDISNLRSDLWLCLLFIYYPRKTIQIRRYCH
jgi:hypothetical protein